MKTFIITLYVTLMLIIYSVSVIRVKLNSRRKHNRDNSEILYLTLGLSSIATLFFIVSIVTILTIG